MMTLGLRHNEQFNALRCRVLDTDLLESISALVPISHNVASEAKAEERRLRFLAGLYSSSPINERCNINVSICAGYGGSESM